MDMPKTFVLHLSKKWKFSRFCRNLYSKPSACNMQNEIEQSAQAEKKTNLLDYTRARSFSQRCTQLGPNEYLRAVQNVVVVVASYTFSILNSIHMAIGSTLRRELNRCSHMCVPFVDMQSNDSQCFFSSLIHAATDN